MPRRYLHIVLLLMTVLNTVSLALPVFGGGEKSEYLSPLAVLAEPQGRYLYIAAHTANQIRIYDLNEKKTSQIVPLQVSPTGLALSKDSGLLYTTAHSLDGKGIVVVVRVPSGEIVAEFPAGHSPCSPIISPDEKTLYVCDQFGNSVLVIDFEGKKISSAIPVSREPVGAALSLEGKYLFVANRLHDGAAIQDHVASKVSVIDTESRTVAKSIELPDGSTDLQGICLSPDERFVYVTHILARYPLPPTQIERGWINTNALSIIDANSLVYQNTVLLDDVDLGAANPWGVACSQDGSFLIVSHAGTHEISAIDRKALHERLEQAQQGARVTEVSSSADAVKEDLSFLTGIRKRVELAGNGPRGISVQGTAVYIAEYFSDSVGCVSLQSDSQNKANSIALDVEKPLDPVRKGEMLFHDANICFQHWQSCASCHPGEARVDGLNWDLINDGIGNPKNAKSMLLSHKTPPAMISGIRDSAEIAVRAGIKYILFAERPDEEAQAIDAYLQTLKPAISPHRVEGELSEAAQRGQLVFEKAGCSSCHSGPYYTDLQSYDVGTGTGMEKGLRMDTPTLIESWRTGPYLHDGRAATMEEVFTQYNPDDIHGATSQLSLEEIHDLVEFVLSL